MWTSLWYFHLNSSSSLLSRERQIELPGVGSDRLQHASHHHLHETDEAAVHEQQQGTWGHRDRAAC